MSSAIEDHLFKALVGAAAIVVIAAGGHYLFSEWQASRQAEKAAEFSALRTKCLAALERLASDEDVTVATNCYLFKGAITQEEFDRRVAQAEN